MSKYEERRTSEEKPKKKLNIEKAKKSMPENDEKMKVKIKTEMCYLNQRRMLENRRKRREEKQMKWEAAGNTKKMKWRENNVRRKLKERKPCGSLEEREMANYNEENSYHHQYKWNINEAARQIKCGNILNSSNNEMKKYM